MDRVASVPLSDIRDKTKYCFSTQYRLDRPSSGNGPSLNSEWIVPSSYRVDRLFLPWRQSIKINVDTLCPILADYADDSS